MVNSCQQTVFRETASPVMIFVGDLHHLNDFLLGALDPVGLQDGVVLLGRQEAVAVGVRFLEKKNFIGRCPL